MLAHTRKSDNIHNLHGTSYDEYAWRVATDTQSPTVGIAQDGDSTKIALGIAVIVRNTQNYCMRYHCARCGFTSTDTARVRPVFVP